MDLDAVLARLPPDNAARGKMTVADVLAASAGPERDLEIDKWCRSVWTACGANRRPSILHQGISRRPADAF
jgi:hypothetical protein